MVQRIGGAWVFYTPFLGLVVRRADAGAVGVGTAAPGGSSHRGWCRRAWPTNGRAAPLAKVARLHKLHDMAWRCARRQTAKRGVARGAHHAPEQL